MPKSISRIKNSSGDIDAMVVDALSDELSSPFCDVREKFTQASIAKPLSTLHDGHISFEDGYYGNAFCYSGKVYGIDVFWSGEYAMNIAILKPKTNSVEVIKTVDADHLGERVVTVMFDEPININYDEFIGVSGGVKYVFIEDAAKYGLRDYGTVYNDKGVTVVTNNFVVIAINLITDPFIGKYENHDTRTDVVATLGNKLPTSINRMLFRAFYTLIHKPEMPFDSIRVILPALANDKGVHDITFRLMAANMSGEPFKEVTVPVKCDGSVQYIDVPIKDSDFRNVSMFGCEVPVSSGIGISTPDDNRSSYCVASKVNPNMYAGINNSFYSKVDNIDGFCLYIEFIRNMKKTSTRKNIIYVGNYPFCDYTSLQDAIDNCEDSSANPVTIYVLPGKYDKFSMIDNDRRLHHISIVGAGKDITVVESDTGNYFTPAAEIWTTGTIKDITFVMNAVTDNRDDTYSYAYAVHSDFGPNGTTVYDNCKFISNAGPAVGIGMHINENLSFTDCDFISTGDGSFGDTTLGAMFCHSALNYNQPGQRTEFRNCLFVDKYGDHGFNATVINDYVKNDEWVVLVENCSSFNKNGPEGRVNGDILSKYSAGNNVESLNYSW